MRIKRYRVFGYYTDEPQVVVDVVDATSDDEAIAKVIHARGGEDSDYTNDGAELLSDSIKSLQKVAKRSRKQVTADVAELARQYAVDEEED